MKKIFLDTYDFSTISSKEKQLADSVIVPVESYVDYLLKYNLLSELWYGDSDGILVEEDEEKRIDSEEDLSLEWVDDTLDWPIDLKIDMKSLTANKITKDDEDDKIFQEKKLSGVIGSWDKSIDSYLKNLLEKEKDVFRQYMAVIFSWPFEEFHDELLKSKVSWDRYIDIFLWSSTDSDSVHFEN